MPCTTRGTFDGTSRSACTILMPRVWCGSLSRSLCRASTKSTWTGYPVLIMQIVAVLHLVFCDVCSASHHMSHPLICGCLVHCRFGGRVMCRSARANACHSRPRPNPSPHAVQPISPLNHDPFNHKLNFATSHQLPLPRFCLSFCGHLLLPQTTIPETCTSLCTQRHNLCVRWLCTSACSHSQPCAAFASARARCHAIPDHTYRCVSMCLCSGPALVSAHASADR
jgi:hypothetical protein